MDKKVQTGKRFQLNLMAMTSLVMLVPASAFISSALHSRSGSAPALVSDSVSFPALMSKKSNAKTNSIKLETVSKRGQQVLLTEDGNTLKETFDVKGRRISKSLSTPKGTLLNRWDFEPGSKKIIRFEVNEYRGTDLIQRRVARWEYSGAGGFVKTNQFFHAKTGAAKSFVESVNAKEIKYKEEWFDEKKRLIAEKLWDPQTGNFVSYFMAEYSLGGWSTRTYLDENGSAVRKVLMTPHGKIFNGGVVKMGKKSNNKPRA